MTHLTTFENNTSDLPHDIKPSNYKRQLKSSEQTYQTIFNNSFDAMLIYDFQTEKYIDANERAGELFGYKKEDLIGLTPKHLKPKVLSSGKKANRVVREAFKKVKRNKRIEFETTNLRSDGTTFETHISLVEIDYQGRHCSLITLKDISEKKKTALALKASEEAYRTIFDNSFDAVLIYDYQANRYLDVNESACKLFKYSKEELLQLSPTDLKPPKTSNGECTAIIVKEALKRIKSEKKIGFETINMKSDGTIFESYITLVDITYHKKKCALATLKDISQQKQVERELKAINDKLQHYIESNLELENFGYLASHDIREPLRTINSYGQLLEKRYSDVLDDRVKEYLGFIGHSARNLNDIVHGLLAYSKVNTKLLDLQAVNVQQMVDDIFILKKHQYPYKTIHFTTENLPTTLQADKFKLYQVFDNLIDNAIKFGTKDTTRNIQVIGKKRKNEWQFEVKDNGIGIDSKYFEKIFLILKRLESKHRTRGSGVGLALCKKAIEQHKGTIWVESELGKGSSFFFTIPK